MEGCCWGWCQSAELLELVYVLNVRGRGRGRGEGRIDFDTIARVVRLGIIGEEAHLSPETHKMARQGCQAGVLHGLP